MVDVQVLEEGLELLGDELAPVVCEDGVGVPISCKEFLQPLDDPSGRGGGGVQDLGEVGSGVQGHDEVSSIPEGASDVQCPLLGWSPGSGDGCRWHG